MAPPAPDDDSEAGKTSGNAAAAAKASRENFLRRLEQQQQQQKASVSESEESKDEAIDNGAAKKEPAVNEDGEKKHDEVAVKPAAAIVKVDANEVKQPVNVISKEEAIDSGATKKDPAVDDEVAVKHAASVVNANEEKQPANVKANDVVAPPAPEKSNEPATITTAPLPSQSRRKEPPETQMLLDYLTKYCDAAGAGSTSASPSSPTDWIGDVDASSLNLLKSLAGIKQNNIPKPPPVNNNTNNPAVASYNTQMSINSTQTSSSSNSKTITTTGRTLTEREIQQAISDTPVKLDKSELVKQWEVTVPPEAIEGQPFHICAKGVKVRVVCPKGAKAGQRIRFNLPVRLFEKVHWSEAVLPDDLNNTTSAKNNNDGNGNGGAVAAGGGRGTPPEQQQPRVGVAPVTNNTTMPSAGKPKEDTSSTTTKVVPKRSSSSIASSNNTTPPTNPSTGTKTNMKTSSDDMSLQDRMMDIIERQRTQMQEMQARLDSLGLMMEHVSNNVTYLCANAERNQQGQIQARAGGAPAQGYSIMGGLFSRDTTGTQPPGAMEQQQGGGPPQMGGARQPGFDQRYGVPESVLNELARLGIPVPEARNELGARPPAVPNALPPQNNAQRMQELPEQPPVSNTMQQRPQQPPEQPVPAGVEAEEVEEGVWPNGVRDNLRADALAPPPPMVNQGIFFPLFVMLFHFLLSLPRRVRSILLHTGPGRVYAHLRREAIARRAFANIDLGSIIKLFVMLLIFTGRVGGGDRDPNVARRNRGFNSGQMNRVGAQDAEHGMLAYAYALARAAYDYWNSHRVHTLILASMIGFLIQVGLMSFLYQVLWVERGDLLRAWLGQDRDGEEDEDLLGGAADADNANNGAAARLPNAPRPGANRPVNDNPHGGMIRRGPENGGIFHDIQCLIMSFLLSLIPAWRPEEAVQDLPAEPDQPGAAQPEIAGVQAGQVGDQTEQRDARQGEGGGAGDENVAE